MGWLKPGIRVPGEKGGGSSTSGQAENHLRVKLFSEVSPGTQRDKPGYARVHGAPSVIPVMRPSAVPCRICPHLPHSSHSFVHTLIADRSRPYTDHARHHELDQPSCLIEHLR